MCNGYPAAALLADQRGRETVTTLNGFMALHVLSAGQDPVICIMSYFFMAHDASICVQDYIDVLMNHHE